MRANSRAGSAAIEFAVVAPVFFLMLFGLIESGIIYFSQATLQYAVNDVARLVRTGQAQNMTQTTFRNRICADITPLLSCNSKLQIDVESFANFSTANYPAPLTTSNNLNPALNNFQLGTACSVVLVRAFYTWSVATPVLTPFLANMSNNNHLVYAAAAFRNEPFTTGISGC